MVGLDENFDAWKRGVIKYCGEQCAENLIGVLGGNQMVREATFAPNADSGSAGKGEFTKQTLNLTKHALALNRMLPQNKQVNEDSIAKVALLSHISKVEMFEEKVKPMGNTLYDFRHSNRQSALRTGEKSIFLCLCAGITFTETEYEAMRIIDLGENDNMAKLYSSTLASVIRMANSMLDLANNRRMGS